MPIKVLPLFDSDVFVPAGQSVRLCEHASVGYMRSFGYVKIVGPIPPGPGPFGTLTQKCGSATQPPPGLLPGVPPPPSGSDCPCDDATDTISFAGVAMPFTLSTNLICCKWIVENTSGIGYVVRVCLCLSTQPDEFL
jgi:hypothetical protein